MHDKKSTKTIEINTHITERGDWPMLLGSFANKKYNYRAICHEGENMTWEYFKTLGGAIKWCDSKHSQNNS